MFGAVIFFEIAAFFVFAAGLDFWVRGVLYISYE